MCQQASNSALCSAAYPHSPTAASPALVPCVHSQSLPCNLPCSTASKFFAPGWSTGRAGQRPSRGACGPQAGGHARQAEGHTSQAEGRHTCSSIGTYAPAIKAGQGFSFVILVRSDSCALKTTRANQGENRQQHRHRGDVAARLCRGKSDSNASGKKGPGRDAGSAQSS
jgi:hypothetical protein